MLAYPNHIRVKHLDNFFEGEITMSLRIIVTVKQVPDTHNISGDAMKPDGTVNRVALAAIFNPEDLNALEEALKLKNRLGATITVVTMGPPKAAEVLKDCLFRGVDDAILVSDRKFAGADTLATSYALKCTIEKIKNYDIIFCGRQAIDGDTAQVGPQLAEKLGINQISCVSAVTDINNESITVNRSTEYGHETLRSKFPVLLTITGETNEPRSPKAKAIMSYKNLTTKLNVSDTEKAVTIHGERVLKYITEWNVESINADPNQCGLAGSPTKVKTVTNVVLTTQEMKEIENSDTGINNLMNELMDEHIIG